MPAVNPGFTGQPNPFDGDITSLDKIWDDNKCKSLLIPGVTCATGVSTNASGSIAYYFKRTHNQDLEVGTPANGSEPVNFSLEGLNLSEIELDKAIQINDIIPLVKTSSSVDVVKDRVSLRTSEAYKLLNKEAIKYMYNNGSADLSMTSEITSPESALGTLTMCMKNYIVNNADLGYEPTAVLVNSTVAAMLLNNPAFNRFVLNIEDASKTNYVLGRVGNCLVIEAPDIDTYSDLDFIILNSEAFIAPKSITPIKATSAVACGYANGVIISGEYRFNFDIPNMDAVLLKTH